MDLFLPLIREFDLNKHGIPAENSTNVRFGFEEEGNAKQF